ncbi:MAG TPA: chromosomal replication initiator protein DnaA [Ktedonobacterales bacterium]|nr:chromosomal replication initiator protein DnaA [Ktedonobacterales bacterium]
MSNGHVWRAAQERLRQQMTRAQFDTWLRGTWLSPAGDGATLLCVRTTFAKELLESRFRDRIEAAIAAVTGQPCRLRVVVTAGGADDDSGATLRPAPTATQSSRATPPHVAPRGEMPTLFASQENHREDTRETHPSDPAAPDLPAPYDDTLLDADGAEVAGTGRASDSSPNGRGETDRAGESSGSARGSWLSERQSHVGGMASMNVHSNGDARFARGDGDGDDGHDLGSSPRQRGYPTPPLDNSSAEAISAISYGGVSIPPPKLNPRYTFETFIVGSGNRLAHAASLAVSEAPGFSYNPLFLYGDVGLGKTHLLHAIGHTAIVGGLVVLYVSSETFTNEIVNAIRYRTTEEFRAKYRSVDMLLVDDIQFIAGKDSTEEEFFHTFNTLHEANKQIVICSDRPPKAIVSLAERLRSRFEWGLIADIQAPDLETRVAILRAKADMMRRDVPDDVMIYLASRVQNNIRELEGSFNRLLAFAQLQGLPLTTETTKAALANLASDGRQRRVSVKEVLDAVAEYYRLSADDLRGKQRDKHIVVPRQVAMYLMRQETDASLLEVGQALGGRDHSTVLHGYEKIAREMNEGTPLRKEVLAIQQQLRG